MKNLIPILLIAGVFTLSFAAGTGSISGVVTDSVTGNPIVGARVCAMRGGNTITNESGEYLIENLTPGDYRVTASAEGYCGKTYPDMVTVVDGQTTTNINFALAPCVPPPRGSISGVVTDSVTGNPIVGARVSVMRGGYAITNQNGEYTIEDIREHFGIDVARIVDGVTKIMEVFDPNSTVQVETFKKFMNTDSHTHYPGPYRNNDKQCKPKDQDHRYPDRMAWNINQ